MMADMVGGWVVWLGGLLVWWTDGALREKIREVIKFCKCVGCIGWEEVLGFYAIFLDFTKGNTSSLKQT
jgi:hypothetical protein